MFSAHELYYIRHFLNGVNYELSNILKEYPNTHEDYLTFLLGHLLDSESTIHRRLLNYTTFDLNNDLKKAGYGNTINFRLDTIEHSMQHEGMKSFADLGFILLKKSPGENEFKEEKGILVQCKKLQAVRNIFKLSSNYGDINKTKQFDNIIEREKDGYEYCYFFYNPLAQAFRSDYNELFKYELEHFPSSINVYECLDHIRTFPGIKVASPNFISNLRKYKFSIRDCYVESNNEKSRGIPSKIPFDPFSLFISNFLNCEYGSNQEKVLELCRGCKIEQKDVNELKGVVSHSVTIEVTEGKL